MQRRTAGRLLVLLVLLGGGCAGDDADDASLLDNGAAGSALGRLDGMDGSEVAALLGPADFVRVDGPAELRQYRGTACVLDVYLYRRAGSGDYRVTYVEARDRQLARIAPQGCLASVARAKRT